MTAKNKRSKYNKLVAPRLDEIANLRMNGSSFADIAELLGVAESSIYRWADEHEEFDEAMSEATKSMYSKIELTANKSLLDKLIDRDVIVEEVIEDGIVVRQKRKKVFADTQAIIFALKSRNPKIWNQIELARVNNDNDADTDAKILELLQQIRG